VAKEQFRWEPEIISAMTTEAIVDKFRELVPGFDPSLLLTGQVSTSLVKTSQRRSTIPGLPSLIPMKTTPFAPSGEGSNETTAISAVTFVVLLRILLITVLSA